MAPAGWRPWGGRADLQQRLITCGLDPHSPIAEKWAAIAERLMRFPRHLSQHPDGFVISRGPLSRLVPIENAAMAERTVIQWDMDDIDELGLLKIDILALGMLSCIARTCAAYPVHRLAEGTLAGLATADGLQWCCGIVLRSRCLSSPLPYRS